MGKMIYAQEGKVFRQKHSGMIFGKEINLGIDYSTGTPREDLEEYYEQIDEPLEAEEIIIIEGDKNNGNL